MASEVFEVNFDGLVGPTYNNAGSAVGNRAAAANRGKPSNPREAALQGLRKMKFLLDHDLKQGVLPPQERPDIPYLRRLGFEGTDAEVWERAGQADPSLLAKVSSAASMWAANAATVSPSSDSTDRRVHFTPANLLTNLHRSLEPEATGHALRRIFPGPCFEHHPPLPAHSVFGDEGAANHMRLCRSHGAPSLHLFVYGRWALDESKPCPAKVPARQTREACAALARLHRLDPERVLLVQQNPAAIDGDVFHNDVIAFGSESLLVVHEQAFLDTHTVLDSLRRRMNGELDVVLVKASEMSLDDVVSSYLFNSQLVALPEGGRILLAPEECDSVPAARRVLRRLLEEKKVDRVERFDLRQSMSNGGGPACLRLRVVLKAEELAGVHRGCLLTEEIYRKLVACVKTRYRDWLEPKDLADPKLLRESREVLDEMSDILGLRGLYPFQSAGA